MAPSMGRVIVETILGTGAWYLVRREKRWSSLMEAIRSIIESLEIYVFAHVAGVSESGVGCRTTISI
jgi:hypothetical protein